VKKMGLLQNLGMALKIFLVFYAGIITLFVMDVGISKWPFSYAGVIAVFFLAISYSFYFKL